MSTSWRRIGGWVLAVAGLMLFTPGLAPAGLRDPGQAFGLDPLRCSAEISGQITPCQFRFHPGGDGDVLTVDVTLRDAFDNPVSQCSTTVTLTPVGPESFNLCTCCGEVQSGFSDSMGTLQVTWDRIGGFGTLEARVTAHCPGDYWIGSPTFDYTSSDLTGTCNESSNPVDILDLALWARGLPPGSWIRSDWDCSGGSADILDAGGWAGGLLDECGDGPPCP